jgi:thiol-disulfide isomerase/thioredoxin
MVFIRIGHCFGDVFTFKMRLKHWVRGIVLLWGVFQWAAASADASLRDTEGNTFRFSSLKGNWVFINYWAGWCAPCLEEIPELNQFYAQNKSNQVKLFGVNYDARPARETKRLFKEAGIKYPGLLDDPSEALHLGDIEGVPLTFVFNPQGKLIKTLHGKQSVSGLTHLFRP